MGTFTFRNREIALDFDGVRVTVSGSREYAKKLEAIGREMVAWGSDNAEAGDEAAKEFMLDILDELLGEEVMDAIEEKRELDIYDCTDMFRYIKDEVFAYHNSAAEPAPQAQPIPMVQAAENRAARRARRKGRRK